MSDTWLMMSLCTASSMLLTGSWRVLTAFEEVAAVVVAHRQVHVVRAELDLRAATADRP